jgi:hypothetical protein
MMTSVGRVSFPTRLRIPRTTLLPMKNNIAMASFDNLLIMDNFGHSEYGKLLFKKIEASL